MLNLFIPLLCSMLVCINCFFYINSLISLQDDSFSKLMWWMQSTVYLTHWFYRQYIQSDNQFIQKMNYVHAHPGYFNVRFARVISLAMQINPPGARSWRGYCNCPLLLTLKSLVLQSHGTHASVISQHWCTFLSFVVCNFDKITCQSQASC